MNGWHDLKGQHDANGQHGANGLREMRDGMKREMVRDLALVVQWSTRRGAK